MVPGFVILGSSFQQCLNAAWSDDGCFLILNEIAWPFCSGYFWCVSSRKRFVWGPKSLRSFRGNAVGG